MVTDTEPIRSEPEWATNNTKNKNVPYWVPNIDDKITPDIRRLLEDYSHVPPEDVEKHIYETREAAWAIRSYPCTGLGAWLTPLLPKCPIYPSILTRARAGARVVDIGCFIGHDLRRITFDGAGVRSANLVGVDIVNHWHIGYSFFRDEGHFDAKFVEADILHPNAEWRNMEGNMDVAILICILHQWDYETQLAAARNVSRLMAVDGTVVGFQMGTAGKEHYSDPTAPRAYRHNVESFQKMWEEVGKQEGTVWETEVKLAAMDILGVKEDDIRYLGEDCRVAQFVVTRKA